MDTDFQTVELEANETSTPPSRTARDLLLLIALTLAVHLPFVEQAFHLESLGSGSDYTPFLQHLGIAALNLGYGGENGGGSYHSIYDSYSHYTRFGAFTLRSWGERALNSADFPLGMLSIFQSALRICLPR